MLLDATATRQAAARAPRPAPAPSQSAADWVRLTRLALQQQRWTDARLAVVQGLQAYPHQPQLLDLQVLTQAQWNWTLVGPQVRLRDLQPRDVPTLVGWLADRAFVARLSPLNATGPSPSEAVVREWVAGSAVSVMRSQVKHWLLERADSGQALGLVSLADIKPSYRRAELLIGLPQSALWGSGLAAQACILVLDHAFGTLGLNKLTSLVTSDNAHSQRGTLGLGFVQEGLLRQHLRSASGGAWVDCYVNGLLADDWQRSERVARLRKRWFGAPQRPHG